MTKEQAFKEINETQDFYISELINKLHRIGDDYMKVINFQSATGTGKTKMMAKLINRMTNVFFIVTTLSKGQLDRQIEANLKKDCTHDNFKVYGCQKYRINSKLQAEDILGLIPKGKKFIWIRDEGHINTNRWEDLLKNKAYKLINFTATPDYADIKCNFVGTMMLRTVHQTIGTPEDAINKLLEVKKQHKKVKNYNPCAIFRCVDDREVLVRIIAACEANGLKYINITEEDFDMSDLCKDDNEYDVIINKFKIVEGIDIRRAHVLYIDNQPNNNKTTIQVIGRCRRNALLYRDDIDIFSKSNTKLLENTRQCFVFYNVETMHIDEDESGELVDAFCDKISVEQLKVGSTINAKNGVLPNGLEIIELDGATGTFEVVKDRKTGFNVIKPEGKFYEKEVVNVKPLLYGFTKEELDERPKIEESYFDYFKGEYVKTGKWYIKIRIKNNYGRYKIKTHIESIFGKVITITQDEYENFFANAYVPFTLKYNDRYSAIIGTDIMKSIKTELNERLWIEEKAVTSKVRRYSKLNSYIETTYAKELEACKPYLFSGKNSFDFDSKCNSCLGYCVEYYSKYLVYGEDFLHPYLSDAVKEIKKLTGQEVEINDNLIIRACMLKYRDMMIKAYGASVMKVIRGISITQLIQDKYKEFVKTVIDLGTKTAEFVKDKINTSDKKYSPILSIKHISGLADYISKDTIIDIKCTNNITKDLIKQVLAYHYLSTKRSDLNIEKVIVYDAVSGKSIIIAL